MRWKRSCPASKRRSSSAQIRPRDLSYCPNAGSSSAPSRGSTAAADSPRIGRTLIAKRSHSCASPLSASCSENFAIPPDVSGQTLRGGANNHVQEEEGGDDFDQEAGQQAIFAGAEIAIAVRRKPVRHPARFP